MKVLSGKSLNAFTVSGQAFKFERKITTVSCIHTPSAEDEAGRFAAAQQTALEQLHELRDTAVSKVGKQLAKIFDIHMVLTLDDDFSDAVRSIISTQRVNAEYAVSLTSYNFSKIFAAMDDDYMKARSADIHDISDRLVSILSGRKQKSAKDFATGANKIICTEDFLNTVDALYNGGYENVAAVYCGGQGGDQGTRAIINNMYGGTFTDAAHTKYTADSAENIKAIQTLYDTNGINFDASIVGGDEITLFRNGTLQMAFCWNIAQQLNSDNNDAGLTNSGDEIMPMAFPTASGDPKLCGGIWGFGVFDNGDEAKVKAAKTFIEFIAADPDQVKDSVLASTYFPVRASVGDIYADNAIMSEYTKFMAYLGDYYQITPGWATARTEWWNMLQRVGTGEDVATSVATFVQNANAAAEA